MSESPFESDFSCYETRSEVSVGAPGVCRQRQLTAANSRASAGAVGTGTMPVTKCGRISPAAMMRPGRNARAVRPRAWRCRLLLLVGPTSRRDRDDSTLPRAHERQRTEGSWPGHRCPGRREKITWYCPPPPLVGRTPALAVTRGGSAVPRRPGRTRTAGLTKAVREIRAVPRKRLAHERREFAHAHAKSRCRWRPTAISRSLHGEGHRAVQGGPGVVRAFTPTSRGAVLVRERFRRNHGTGRQRKRSAGAR